MKVQIAALLILLFVLVIPLAAQDSSEDSTITITDATGTTLTFETVPERVICLFHECIELVSALGIEPVAMLAPTWLPNFADDPAYFPQPNAIVKLLPDDSGSYDYEAIAALQPDIVFGSDEDRVALEGITQVYSVGNTYSMSSQDTLDHLLDYARIFNREAEAQAQIARFQYRLAAYKALSPRDQLVLLVAYWDEGAWIYSGVSVPCSILNEVAVCDWDNPDPQPGSWGYSSTVEAVLQLDPGVIILENWTELSNEDALEQLRRDPLWSELRAVQNNRIFLMQNRDAYGLGPIGGARLLDLYVPLIYPDVFPEPLTDEQVQEILAGGNNAESDGSDLSIVDGTSTTLTFKEPPQRIVCLYSRCLELLAALEVVPVGIMVSFESFAADPAYFPQPNEIALINWDGDVPDIEQIAALQPDLVLGWQELQAPLAGIAPVYSVINEQDSYQESHDEIRAFGRLLGREDIAEANITTALNRLAAYKQLSPGDVSVMDVFFSNDTSYYRDGESGTCNLLKAVAVCDWPDPSNATTWSVEANDEALLQLDPDVILVSTYGFEGLSEAEIRAQLAERPLWAELSAMQSGRVYIEPEGVNLDGMGTVGMIRMLDRLMPLLYPDVFPEPLTDEQVQQILAEAE
jgi:iron complex transport system substrate-binding protein